MKHVMVDLETLAATSNAAIVSIGAVAFDPETGALGPEFKVNVDGVSSQQAGGYVEAGTVAWWFAQSNEARAHLNAPKPVTLGEALIALSVWLRANLDEKFHLWGNGATFDNVILRSAYASVGLPAPWHFTRDACYRTMKNLFPAVKAEERTGVHHDSLDDARHQTRHLCAIFASIKPRTPPELVGECGSYIGYE